MSLIIKLNKYAKQPILPDVWFRDEGLIVASPNISWQDLITPASSLSSVDSDTACSIDTLNGFNYLLHPAGYAANNSISTDGNTIITPSLTLIAIVKSIRYPGSPGFPDWNDVTDQCYCVKFGSQYIALQSGGVGAYPLNLNQNFNLHIYDGTTDYNVATGLSILNNGWQIVAYRWNNDTKEATLWLNGDKYSDIFSGIDFSGNGTMILNGDSISSPGSWGGGLGESKIYNKAVIDGVVDKEITYFSNKYNLSLGS